MDEESPLIQPFSSINSYEKEYKKEIAETTKKESFFSRKKSLLPRYFPVNGRGIVLQDNGRKMPKNEIHNNRYNLLTFLPICLYEQFKSFINLYYLILSLSQFVPALRVGPILTYAAPLAFVVALSLSMEAYLDIKRYLRDKRANSEEYMQLTPSGLSPIPASEIKVGHFIHVDVNRRIPADMLVLRTTSEAAASYIRTDQLDGETDWKLRKAVHYTQHLESDNGLFHLHNAHVYAEKPKKDIYDFVGNFIYYDQNNTRHVEPLNLENTVWSSTVLASDSIIGLVLYTGAETRSVLNTRTPSTKRGIIETELNVLTVMLCVFAFVMAGVLLAVGGFKGLWWLDYFVFLVLMSAVIPISMKVNMDLAKFVYAWFVVTDDTMPGCLVRNTNIAEEMGRISYLLSDKTGTLTQNEMIFKKLHMGSVNFSSDTINEIKENLNEALNMNYPHHHHHHQPHSQYGVGSPQRNDNKFIISKKSLPNRVLEVITAIALCHNVTPVHSTADDDLNTPSPLNNNNKSSRNHNDDDDYEDNEYNNNNKIEIASSSTSSKSLQSYQSHIIYQASSPDEVSLVKFTESVGITLYHRTFTNMTLLTSTGAEIKYEILETFPFSSERKRMGIILRNIDTNEIKFLMKGADVIMTKIVQHSDWLEEECDNLAREGLRTLVFGSKTLSEDEWLDFKDRLHIAQSSMKDRDANVNQTICQLEENLELLALTGVEDKLQDSVKNTLETLRNAGVNIWMLTGDKRETATCIGISSKLISRSHSIYHLDLATSQKPPEHLLDEFARQYDSALIIDGNSLQVMLEKHKEAFFNAAQNAPSVVCCRCSPTQKAEVVEMIKVMSKKQVAAIGDGGNDVSMIQSANIGIGIVGKEGKQASLAADYSVLQFKDIAPLFLWHGRNAYHNSAMLSQFIIYRGLISTFVQAVFSAIFYLSPVTVGYTGALAFGYSSWYTMTPVFALTLDHDISQSDAILYPELYSDLKKGRALTAKTFLLFVLIAVYQAIFIQLIPMLFDILNYVDMISLTFTACVFTTLLMVAMVVNHWNTLMFLCMLSTVVVYPLFMIVLPSYYDLLYVSTIDYWTLLLLLLVVSCLPVKILQFFVQRCFPTASRKLKGHRM